MYSRLATTLSLALMTSTATIAVQGAAQAAETYDCVIEPFLVVKVGSPIEGVMAEISIKRGAPVKKGQVLGRLESSVEEQTLRMAEANAKLAIPKTTNDIKIITINFFILSHLHLSKHYLHPPPLRFGVASKKLPIGLE